MVTSAAHFITPTRTPLQRWSTHLGSLATVAAGLGIAMFIVALSLGVHCPECDYAGNANAAGYQFWSTWFAIEHVALLFAAVGSLISIPLSLRRMRSIATFFVVLMFVALQPR